MMKMNSKDDGIDDGNFEWYVGEIDDRQVQAGHPTYVSLLTAVPSVTLVKKRVLKKTQGIKRVL